MNFRAIDLDKFYFVGEREKDGARLHVDLWRVADLKVRNISEGQTLLAGSALVLGGGGTLAGMAVLAAILGTTGSGRPLRVADSNVAVRAPVFLDKLPQNRLDADSDETTRARILAHWTKEASAECASIPAFWALARDLQRASAPTNLVQAAHRAAREEATHTRFCLDRLEKHADAPARTIIPAISPANDASHEALLERLVLEAFWDGCIAEGAAAAVARRSARKAKDEQTRLALETIAQDEHGHADLAREIIRFGLSTGGRSIRNALAESIEKRAQEVEKRIDATEENGLTEGDSDEDLAAAYGLPGRTMARAAQAEVWERNVSLLG